MRMAAWRTARGLASIASGIGIDPTLPRDGTDFMTLRVVMRTRVWLRLEWYGPIPRWAQAD